MSQEYTPVEWVDETPEQMGTLINKARLDQMQSAHHFADGFEEVDTVPTADPQVAYHKVVYCTADSTFYRWDGTQWTKDIDDSTLALLQQEIQRATDAEDAIARDLSDHENDHANPHQVTKAQVGLGNCDNTSDADKPVSTAQQTALDAITVKIPAQASSSNQLADKDFVNSSIATNTANFLGTYDAETDLGFTSAQVDAFTDPPDASTVMAVGIAVVTKLSALGKTVTNNDYVFITVNKSTTVDTDWYWRFKYDGSAWVYEFTLNHSSFTSVQWAAINSGITAQLVGVIPTLCRKYSGSVTVATSAWAASGITAYPYKANITVTGITANDYPTVAFGQADAVSGNYSPECDTSAGTLTIYAKAVPSAAITISYMIIQDVS